ncbi:MAG TPA: orotidine-5'-phosphate decarboxylase [Terracidiphilus sp.]|jgi:orotidine-5'-phosphate decarboxylase|nr:orotidine-5'-phosphate decarboxylase [Terracidiphilus sp.]
MRTIPRLPYDEGMPVEPRNPSAAKAANRPGADPRERLIVALDVPDARAASLLVDRLDDTCAWFKVGLELFVSAGPAVIEPLLRRGYSVFLDLKLHDIPNTVAGAVRSAASLGARMLTVHAGGGPAMLAAAQEALSGVANAPQLLAVTVLTSMDAGQLNAIGIDSPPAAQVDFLARMGLAAGIRGFVCSPQEVATLRALTGPEATLVIPGIRPAGGAAGDQKRVATPGDALRNGASYLVVGRPITLADDPAKAAEAILEEMSQAL